MPRRIPISLEGDFSTWTYLVSMPTFDWRFGLDSFAVKNDGTVIYYGYTPGLSVCNKNGEEILVDPMGGAFYRSYMFMGGWFSILGKYFIYADVEEWKVFKVLKDNELVFSRDITLDNSEVTDVGWGPGSISPNGKYIALLARLASGDYVIMIYEGS